VPPVATIFTNITPIFLAIATVLDPVPSSAVVLRVPNILTGIANILTPVSPIFAAIHPVLDAVTTLLSGRLRQRCRHGQQRDEQCWNHNLVQSHRSFLRSRRYR